MFRTGRFAGDGRADFFEGEADFVALEGDVVNAETGLIFKVSELFASLDGCVGVEEVTEITGLSSTGMGNPGGGRASPAMEEPLLLAFWGVGNPGGVNVTTGDGVRDATSRGITGGSGSRTDSRCFWGATSRGIS